MLNDFQLRPSQWIAMGTSPGELSDHPTAQTSVPETPPTPVRPLESPGPGLVNRDQLAPSKCSMSVCCPNTPETSPTAHTSPSEKAATASSSLVELGATALATFQAD